MGWTARRALVVGLATSLLSLGLGIGPASAGAEGSLVSRINSERTSRGIDPLQVYWDLTDDAGDQAQRMRDEQQISHHPNLGSVTDEWSLLGENVGVGPSVDLIMDAFMASAPHRSNVLNGAYNYVGVGVAEDSAGLLWVSVIFMAGPDDLLDPPTTTTTTTTQPPSTTTTTTQPPSTTTTTTQPPSTTTTTTQPPSTTTTTQPLSTTTTTQPPSTTTTTQVPGGDGGPGLGDPAWTLSYDEFVVLGPDWLPPGLLRLIGFMAR